MNSLDPTASLGLFGTGLSQHARLITLASAQDSGLPQSLMAEQICGREAVNELFSFDVDALSVSTDLELSMFIGEELTITLLQPDASRRAWHGICTEAAWLGADGGVARYRLHLGRQPSPAVRNQIPCPPTAVTEPGTQFSPPSLRDPVAARLSAVRATSRPSRPGRAR